MVWNGVFVLLLVTAVGASRLGVGDCVRGVHAHCVGAVRGDGLCAWRWLACEVATWLPCVVEAYACLTGC